LRERYKRDSSFVASSDPVRDAFESSLYAGLKAGGAMALAAPVCGGKLETLGGEKGITPAQAREFLKNILEAEAEHAHDNSKARK
jgi:hypothetical protein